MWPEGLLSAYFPASLPSFGTGLPICIEATAWVQSSRDFSLRERWQPDVPFKIYGAEDFLQPS